jgi:chaperonin GroEL (HSP60 family)
METIARFAPHIGRAVRGWDEPARQIASNSGIDLGVALEKIRSLTENANMGLDAATGRYVDLVLAEIIDPTKVVRVGLENAVSVACGSPKLDPGVIFVAP